MSINVHHLLFVFNCEMLKEFGVCEIENAAVAMYLLQLAENIYSGRAAI